LHIQPTNDEVVSGHAKIVALQPTGESRKQAVQELTASRSEPGEARLKMYTHIEQREKPVPEDYSICARFDDQFGPVWISKPMKYQYAKFTCSLVEPAYRRQIHASAPTRRIAVEWSVDDDVVLTPYAHIGFELLDVGGQTVMRQAAPLFKWSHSWDVSDLAPGRYTLLIKPHFGADLTFKDPRSVRFDEKPITHDIDILPPVAWEAYLDGDGVLYANGKPQFPLGLYGANEGRLEADINPAYEKVGLPRVKFEDVLDEVKARRFDTVLADPFESDNFWAEIGKRGLRAGVGYQPVLKSIFSTISAQPRDARLLVWFAADEMAGEWIAPSNAAYDAVSALDPYRPIGTAINMPELYGEVLQAVDIVMPDIYPIVKRPAPPHRPSVDLSRLYQCTRYADEVLPPGKAVWGVVQAFREGAWVVPTPEEYRVMCYLYLAAGARGLFTFCYPGVPIPIDDDVSTWTQLWDAMKPINAELKSLDFVWTAPAGKYWLSGPRANIAVMERNTERGTVRVMVNMSYDPVNLVISVPARWSQARELISQQVVELSSSQITASFEPLAVRAYLFEE